jgi:hypothetical protein
VAVQRRYQYDVFISHNHQNKPWVRKVVAQWRKALRLRVFFDEDTMLGGENILDAIGKGIQKSRHVVLVITPSSVASNWVAMEAARTMFLDLSARQRRLIPVMLEVTNERKIPWYVRILSRIDLTDPATRRNRYHHLLRSLGVGQRTLPPLPT